MERRQLTTLEEDFRALGILPQREAAPAPAVTEARARTASRTPIVDDAEEAGPVDEVKRVRTKRSSQQQRRKWRMQARRNKSSRRAYRRKASTKRKVKLHARKIARMGGAVGGRVRLMTGTDRESNIVERVQEILDTPGEVTEAEARRGFAGLALAAEKLSEHFSQLADRLAEPEYSEIAEDFAEMAVDAAAQVEEMEAGDRCDRDVLDEVFRGDMETLLDGLDLYGDLTSGDEGNV